MNRPKSGCNSLRFRVLCLALLGTGWMGCATIPKGQYGVKDIEWVGTQQMDDKAVESCLVTRERTAVNIMLGVSAPSCGEPPFDTSAPTIDLWTLPWTDWPVFDPAIFDVERERIERWYRARGYYDAKVTGVQTFVHGKPVDPNECTGKEQSDCVLKIVVTLTEGKATYIEKVAIKSNTKLPEKLMQRMTKALQLRKGRRIDEYYYEADKKQLESILLTAAYARAKVSGRVLVDRNRRTAYVEYQLDPGPECVFGKLTVEGLQHDDDVPVSLIIEAGNIQEGEKYDQELVDDAQRSIFALNVFSSVRVERRGEGRVVDLVAIVQRGRIATLSAGFGVMSGTMVRPTSAEAESVPQWDIHLSGTWENRNFLGGLRRLRIEERPRLIFKDQFPFVPPEGVALGNIVNIRFDQPSTFERRTKLVVSAGWDYGPDPYASFTRHDVSVKVGLERPFFNHKLLGRIAIGHDLYAITTDGPQLGYSSYRFPFLEQQLVLDLRDDPQRPRLGLYISFLIQESARLGGYASWDYFRMIPDARVYLPLPFSIVLAMRFALGAILVSNPAGGLDLYSGRLGPQTYRLRGGGAVSNRGFLASRLGDSYYGGTRRWESSIELRVPVGGNFGFVLFGDMGDVSDTAGESSLPGQLRLPTWEFRKLNAATGLGLRYFSVLGAIRLDAGWRIPGLQEVGVSNDGVTFGLAPSAVHFTIGEAF